ncbi:glycosyltransferase family 4 protein [Winogradskyella endarachnes]|uniref:Glycosyltransferase n=1 Tax=Winogradskyella endarachnes TaxID=2681965 RepID=A0A6L6U618_9FLAO|nr:glycosyltransferase [Winogradskyella endarachnes]MUU77650.1 glycosyltransferase [Winogradskyella endarachnes]
MKNLLVFGPIGDFGGRELETGFIASSLSDDYNVTILTTNYLTHKSQVFDFVKESDVKILNQLIYNRNIWFKIITYIAYLKSFRKKPILSYVSNKLAKKTGYRNYAIKQIEQEIDNNEAIVVCAQITSNYIDHIVNYAYKKQIPVFFRTSNTIKVEDVFKKNWLNKVTLFAHHSFSNAERLSSLKTHNYKIIDQCTFKEDELLSLKPSKAFKNVLCIGRFSDEKGIKELFNFFANHVLNLNIKIIGDGKYFNELKSRSESIKNVELLGFLNQTEILKHFERADAIIIPSFEESGPLVGLEAMAAAKLVVSTKVGAMEERLKGLENQFWFNINSPETLEKVLQFILKLNSETIEKIALENRRRYVEKYKMTMIKSQYKNAIFKLLQK